MLKWDETKAIFESASKTKVWKIYKKKFWISENRIDEEKIEEFLFDRNLVVNGSLNKRDVENVVALLKDLDKENYYLHDGTLNYEKLMAEFSKNYEVYRVREAVFCFDKKTNEIVEIDDALINFLYKDAPYLIMQESINTIKRVVSQRAKSIAFEEFLLFLNNEDSRIIKKIKNEIEQMKRVKTINEILVQLQKVLIPYLTFCKKLKSNTAKNLIYGLFF